MTNPEEKTQKVSKEEAPRAANQVFFFPHLPGVTVEAGSAAEAAEKVKNIKL